MRRNATNNLVNKVKALKDKITFRVGARVLSPNSGVHPGVRADLLELSTSFGMAGPRFAPGPNTNFAKARLEKTALATLMVALLSLLGVSCFSNSAYAAFSASISRSGGTISLAEAGQNSIRPTSTGTLGTGSDTVNVTTNCSYGGYNLYVSATSSGGTNLSRSGATTSELADASNYITTSTTATGSETTLSKDTWGVGKTASAFSGLQAYNADAGTLKAFYTGTSTSDYTFYYGVNVSTAKTPGTYTGEVLYTVLMDEACTKYTLNFDGNSATTNNLASQSITFDDTINLADISSASKIARTGYTLTGWKDQSGNSYGTSGTADINPSDLATVTLTAQWQINSNNVTVNKGTNVTTVSGTNSYNYDSTVTIAATAFSTGYHFNGWTVNSGGATLYSNSAMTTQSTTTTPAYFRMPDNAVTVTANAAANTYIIAYNANGGSGSPATASNTGTYGGNVTTSNTGTMAKTGYHILGWSTSSSATSATCSVNASCSVSTLASNAGKTGAGDNGSTITLYAVWAANTYTIAYNANGGSGSTASQSVTYNGGNVTLRANGFSYSGYTFQGWSRSSGASNTVHYNANTSYAVSTLASNAGVAGTNGATINLYAVWQSSVSDCSDTVHPTSSTGCKMKDGRTWILGNSGNSTTWSSICTNAQNADDPTDSKTTYASCSSCPSGYTFPRITDFDKLVQAYGGTSYSRNRSGYRETTGALYKVLGLSSVRRYWSSTEYSSDFAYRLYVDSGSSDSSVGYSKTLSNYVLCYK